MNRLATTLLVLGIGLLAGGCMSFRPAPLPGEPEEASYAELSQARVRYVDEGEGPAVVFLHGFGSSIEAWHTVLPKVAKDYRVIALDLKGFGWSGRPEGDYSPEAEAELVFELLDRLEVEDVRIVAHSWGSSVALKMAKMQADRVERLALYGAWVYSDQLPAAFYWARAKGVGEVIWSLFYKQLPNEKLAGAFYDKDEITQAYADEVKRMLDRPGTVRAALEAVRGHNFEQLEKTYPTVEQPALLMWGREDYVSNLRYGERLVRDLPNAELEVYPRCGHFPMKEAAAASTRDLISFLNEEEGS